MQFENIIVSTLTPVLPTYLLFTEDIPATDFITFEYEEAPNMTKAGSKLKVLNLALLLVTKSISNKETIKEQIKEAFATAPSTYIKFAQFMSAGTQYDEQIKRHLTRIEYIIYSL